MLSCFFFLLDLLKRVNQNSVAKGSLEIICPMVNLHGIFLKGHSINEVLYACFHYFKVSTAMISQCLLYRISFFSVLFNIFCSQVLLFTECPLVCLKIREIAKQTF